jgi:hypothetical protein
MAAQNCSRCNAPLPMAPPGTVVVCTYCQAETRIDDGKPPVRVPKFPMPMPTTSFPPTARKSPLGLVVMLVIIPVVGGIIWWANRPKAAASSASATDTEPGSTTPAGPKKVSPAALATATETGWITLDAPGMVGTFDKFDPGANLSWATSIARQWSNDAVFDAVYSNGVRFDGTLDLAGEGDSDTNYAFHSPAREQAAASLAQVTEQAPLTSLRLWVHKGLVDAMLEEYDGHMAESRGTFGAADKPPTPAAECTPARIMELQTKLGLPRRPAYRVRLDANRDGRWGWQVSADDDDGPSRPAVMADTCKAPAPPPDSDEPVADPSLYEPFDWSRYTALAGCGCDVAPPQEPAVWLRSSTFMKQGNSISGGFVLSWVLRGGEATPFVLATDDQDTAPLDYMDGIELTLAAACDAERLVFASNGRATAWSRADGKLLWSVTAGGTLDPAAGETTELPVRMGDFSLKLHCAKGTVADGVATLPLAEDGSLRLNVADGTVATGAPAEAGTPAEAPAAPAAANTP